MKSRNRAGRTHPESERGATLILVAITMTVLIGAAGMAIDLGRGYTTDRSLQLVADNAAIDAGRYLAVPETVSLPSPTNNLTVHAVNSAAQNGSHATLTVIQGKWNGSFTSSDSLHCKAQSPPSGNVVCNAVEVTATTHFSGLLGKAHSVLSRTAYAEVTPEAAFSIGTYLASYSSTQKSALGSLLGKLGVASDLTVVAAGYGGLANTDVTIQQLINASGGVLTPQNVMSLSITGANWVTYLSRAVQSQAALLNCTGSTPPAPCAANSVLGPFSGTTGADSTVSMQLCKIVSINGLPCGTQLPQTALSASLNVLQTLTTEAELANGTSGIDLTSALGLTNAGLPITATLTLRLIQPPQVVYGPVPSSATTGQVSASLNLAIPISPVGNETLTVPVAAATGTAQLNTITCSANSLVKATIPASTTASGPNSILLNGTPIASMTVTGTSNVIGFPAAVVPPTFNTENAHPSTNPVVISTTNPNLVFGSQATGLDSAVTTLLNTTLSPVLSPSLQALGVTLAGASVADLGTTCAAVSLVK